MRIWDEQLGSFMKKLPPLPEVLLTIPRVEISVLKTIEEPIDRLEGNTN